MLIVLIGAAVVAGVSWLAQTLLPLWSAIPKRNEDLEP
jgi:Flp pilus assembly pilin Flp